MESNADGVKKNSAEDHRMPIHYLARSGGGCPKTPNVPAFFHSSPFFALWRAVGARFSPLSTFAGRASDGLVAERRPSLARPPNYTPQRARDPAVAAVGLDR